jgi:ATP-dependent DNA helicase DinG
MAPRAFARYTRAVTEATGERSALSFFPEGKTPRPEQIRAIRAAEREFRAGKTFVAIQAPTGSGKSYIAIAHARETADRGAKTHLITAQKILMEQYSEEFAPPLVEPIKGRMNYPCQYDPLTYQNAARGYCRRSKKKGLIQECLKYGSVEAANSFILPPEAHKCDYWRQLALAVENPITLYNFHSFLFQQRLERFGKRELMIIDECHNTEAVLLGFVQIVFSDKLLQLLGIKLDLTLKDAKSIVAWLEKERVVERIKKAVGDGKGEDVPEGLTAAETDQLNELLGRIDDLLRFLDLTEWVVDVTEDILEGDVGGDRTRKLRIRPVFIRPFTKEMIWSKADRVIAMSGTILDAKTWAMNLGIPKASIGFVDIPSSFPVRNRPILRKYAGNMGWQHLEATLPNLYATVGEILGMHAGQRGIIHGHSERLCRLIRDNVKSPRIIHLDMFQNRDKAAMLRAHLARPDSVLLASGFHEGVDLKDDLARFQMIAKIPWPGTADKFVKARMEIDGSYLSYQATLKFVQSYGRGVRHDRDYCTTYVLDSGFDRFLQSCGWLLPKYVVEAIEPSRK